MNVYSITSLRYLLSLLLLINANSLMSVESVDIDMVQDASSTEESNDEDRFIPAGSRAVFTIEERLAIQTRLAAEPEKSESDPLDVANMQRVADSFPLANKLEYSLNSKAALPFVESPKASAAVLVTTHPGAFHTPIAVGPLGGSVELEDNSRWLVRPDDGYKVVNWLNGDRIVILPNHEWFSIYNYRLYNENTGVSVAVNLILYLHPAFHTILNRRLVAYDDVLQMLYLDDGSMWSVTGYDYSRKWAIGDTVIIGINDGWLSSSRPNILINATILHHVRANCLN